MSGLSRFALPPLPHTGLFGVFLGVHAIGDALHVLHTGVGCKGKTQRQLVDHDLGREAHARVGWTELAEQDLIRDAAPQLLRAASELQSRRRAAALLVTTSTAVELTSPDVVAVVEQLRQTLGVPVVWLPGASTQPDLYAGYASVVRAMVSAVDWAQPVDPRPTVSLVGYWFHRYEHEQAANLAELRRLLTGLGATLGPTFLAGEAVATLQRAHGSGLLVKLPYGGPEDLGLTGRAVCAAPWPMGLRATAAWLRAVGAALGVSDQRVARLVDQQESRVAERLALVRRQLAGRRLAVMADTVAAAGWVLLAEELGLEVGLVALLDRSLGGGDALRAAVAAAGGTLGPATQVVDRPTLPELRGLGGDLSAPPDFDVVVRPDLSLAGTGWLALPTVETGFPAPHKHFVYPSPELGYNGAVALAQRLLDAVGGVF